MTGHIRRAGKNSWSVILYLGREAQGRPRYKWHTVRGTKKDAERELARLLNAFNTGDYVAPSKMTVAEYLERWLRDHAEHKVAGRTFQRYGEIVRKHLIPALGRYQLSKLQPLHIQECYTEGLKSGRRDGEGGLSPTTVLQHHRVLREALKHAVRWQLLSRNPAD